MADEQPKKPAYITWEGNTPREADLILYGDAMKHYDGVGNGRSSAAWSREFLDIEPNKSVRSEYNRSDYDAFRWGEMIPNKKKQDIKLCMDAYKRVGIVRNVIDLMGDFGSQGIEIVHPDESVEKFYREWAKKIGFKERSERFLNTLYRTGNVFIYTSNAKITPKVVTYLKTSAAKNGDIILKVPTADKDMIPWRYNFLNPLTMKVKEGDFKMFVARNAFTQTMPEKFVDTFSNGDPAKQSLIKTLPIEVQRQIMQGARDIELDPSKLSVFHYKKDDWDDWADPMILAIMDDIIMLEKMRLADMSALDGAISNIRLWTLGNFEYKILPTKEGVNKLRNILASNVGGGVLDLIWGPELVFKESNSQVYKFLGSEKYQSVLNGIYAGLGVPPTMTGLAGNGGGFTNNFISLKTLIERLQYGRDRLATFWNAELEKIRRVMGFRKPAYIRFDHMNLSDDTTEKNLLIQLYDRQVLSSETLLDRFKEIGKVERVRIARDEKARNNDRMPPMVSPFHPVSHLDDELTKMDKQFEHDSKEHDKDLKMKETQIKNRPKTAPGSPPAKKPVNKNGRPQNSPDSKPRQKRRETPRNKPGVASAFALASDAFETVSTVLNSAYLQSKGINDLRKLTKPEIAKLEAAKLDVFCNIDIEGDITPEVIKASLLSGESAPYSFIRTLKTDGIQVDKMPLFEYKRGVVATYVEMNYVD